MSVAQPHPARSDMNAALGHEQLSHRANVSSAAANATPPMVNPKYSTTMAQPMILLRSGIRIRW